jgi:hypothetical protein
MRGPGPPASVKPGARCHNTLPLTHYHSSIYKVADKMDAIHSYLKSSMILLGLNSAFPQICTLDRLQMKSTRFFIDVEKI